MEGRDATCCGGPNGWKNCGQLTRKIQFDKFRELLGKNADTLITACPKCFIHFKCSINSKLPSDLADKNITFRDLNMVLEQATRGGEK
jgi:Fe-S oxidoreductase